MRTTIEIRDDLRARLLALAAQRGDKGYSRIVEEALEQYLDRSTGSTERLQRARAAAGSLSDEEAEAMRERIHRLREHWR